LKFLFVLFVKYSPYKIYLETGYLMENFVNDWYSTTKILEVSTCGGYPASKPELAHHKSHMGCFVGPI